MTAIRNHRSRSPHKNGLRIKQTRGRLGKAARRQRRRLRHAGPDAASWARAQVRPAQLANQDQQPGRQPMTRAKTKAKANRPARCAGNCRKWLVPAEAPPQSCKNGPIFRGHRNLNTSAGPNRNRALPRYTEIRHVRPKRQLFRILVRNVFRRRNVRVGGGTESTAKNGFWIPVVLFAARCSMYLRKRFVSSSI
jgi:hypothetical protein